MPSPETSVEGARASDRRHATSMRVQAEAWESTAMHMDDHRPRRRTRPGLGLLACLPAMALVTAAASAALGLLGSPHADAGEPRSKVILNGKLVQVTFNDGDSFRVLAGDMQGAKARLSGYNTLESYGPVHQWGTWTEKELYVMAKMATYHARKGVWECETDGATDTYGRMLVWCPDLAEDLVRRGMAHVLTVGDEPGDPKLVEAQREAIEARRGLWSHGVPDFILTSLHSAEEDSDGSGTYNRLVSTEDGHSVKWKHQNRYVECSKVCHMIHDVDAATIDEVAKALREDSAVATIVEPLDDQALRKVVSDFARFRHVDREVAKDDRDALTRHLQGYAAAGRFGNGQPEPGACMVHIDFKRRFGTGRAACLK
ncbi:thermonuclease family protein [Paraliomyxa miuraensis]|uniref:thermonuclease family protein n=1 Tax=Paraliomyxa miuraensis TaxID=376150 RepID=UPI002253964E|nr:thermonuclease family protein [Paraliomyxa miuraensis]MCX4240949.1 thermonuclease family protein [Paraliomyxa miuraensis]